MFLEVQGLSKTYGGLNALSQVSLTVQREKITALIGPNGAGKTSLFNCVTGLVRPDSGKLRFRGQSMSSWKPHQYARMGIARTFQSIRLFAEMTALENVMVGAHSRSHAGVWGALLRSPRVLDEERSLASKGLRLLESIGLLEQADVWARELPYGAQRRLEIARALAADPELLLLDEPAAGMNPNETAGLMDLIQNILNQGTTVLLIEHDMKLVMGISHQVYVLDHGEMIAEGTPGEIQQNPLVIEAYLGRGTKV